MQITGQILNIVPNGTFNSAHGLVYKFNMTIKNGPNDGDELTGGINSKSQNYPMQVGEEITVESTTNNYGINFKKINQ